MREIAVTRARLIVFGDSGLYGLLKFHEITGDKRALDIALAWFRDRFEVGTTKVSVPSGMTLYVNILSS